MTGRKPDERIRTPMRWDATPPAGRASRRGRRGSRSATTRPGRTSRPSPPTPTRSSRPTASLIRLRTAHPALAHGELVPVEPGDRRVVAYLRHAAGDETVLVVANLAR